MKVLVQLRKVFRPCSQELLGFQLQAAEANLAARRMLPTDDGLRATRQAVPSFRKPYLLAESMVYGTLSDVSPADLQRFLAHVDRMKVGPTELYGKTIESLKTVMEMTHV